MSSAGFQTTGTDRPKVPTTSPLTASLLVSMYQRFTASVTTMLRGVRKGAWSSEEEADWPGAGTLLGGTAAAGLACLLMPATSHSYAVA